MEIRCQILFVKNSQIGNLALGKGFHWHSLRDLAVSEIALSCFEFPIHLSCELLKIGICDWTLSSTAKFLEILFEKPFAQCLNFPIRELKFYNSYLLSDFQAIYWLPTLQNGVGNRDKVYFYAEGDKAMVERKKICEQNELSNSWIFQNWSFMTIIWHRISRQTL